MNELQSTVTTIFKPLFARVREAPKAGGQPRPHDSFPVLREVPTRRTWPQRARGIWAGRAFTGGLVLAGFGMLTLLVLFRSALEPPVPSPAAVPPRSYLAGPTDVPATRDSLAFLPALPTSVARSLAQTSPSAAPPTATAVPTPSPTPAADLPTSPVILRLTDAGGRRVLFDPAVGTLRQDPLSGGANTYQPGDVFVDPLDGREWTWVGGTTFTSPVGTLLMAAFSSS